MRSPSPSLVESRRLGQRRTAAFAVFILACCATGLSDYRRAAQLTGATDAAEAEINLITPHAYVWTPIEEQVRQANMTRLRQALGQGAFEQAYAAGRALSFDQAAYLALGRLRSAN